MYCPKCKAEYREDFINCADCQVDRISELPKEPERKPQNVPDHKPEYIDYACLLTTFNPGDIAIIKSILDGTDIKYFIKGDHFAKENNKMF